jgi:hypothetical protein
MNTFGANRARLAAFGIAEKLSAINQTCVSHRSGSRIRRTVEPPEVMEFGHDAGTDNDGALEVIRPSSSHRYAIVAPEIARHFPGPPVQSHSGLDMLSGITSL